jgi:hypothetical protein
MTQSAEKRVGIVCPAETVMTRSTAELALTVSVQEQAMTCVPVTPPIDN